MKVGPHMHTRTHARTHASTRSHRPYTRTQNCCNCSLVVHFRPTIDPMPNLVPLRLGIIIGGRSRASLANVDVVRPELMGL